MIFADAAQDGVSVAGDPVSQESGLAWIASRHAGWPGRELACSYWRRRHAALVEMITGIAAHQKI